MFDIISTTGRGKKSHIGHIWTCIHADHDGRVCVWAACGRCLLGDILTLVHGGLPLWGNSRSPSFALLLGALALHPLMLLHSRIHSLNWPHDFCKTKFVSVQREPQNIPDKFTIAHWPGSNSAAEYVEKASPSSFSELLCSVLISSASLAAVPWSTTQLHSQTKKKLLNNVSYSCCTHLHGWPWLCSPAPPVRLQKPVRMFGRLQVLLQTPRFPPLRSHPPHCHS